VKNLVGCDIELKFGQKTILHDISLEVPKGKVSIIIGPNGSGKSTLLKTLARILKPNKGNVFLDGKDINRSSSKEVAKKLSLMPQSPTSPEDITVRDLIFFGRHPHQGPFSRKNKTDMEAVEKALSLTNLESLKDRFLHQLSGGQRQRAWLAMSLAQETDILFLDEPTTYLDLHYQFEILDLLKELNLQKNLTVMMVLHDLNLASLYGDYLFVVHEGQIYSKGRPEECLSKKLLEDVFNIAVHETTLYRGKPQFIFSSHFN
jgi:iron complex transport system ATP-binding protein